MPPRFAYWTILIDGKPTAFRARDHEELLPTLNQLKRTNKDVRLQWFARGKLWESPDAERAAWRARDAGAAPRGKGDVRGRDWRPGGEHKDPRQHFRDQKKQRNQERRAERHERRERDSEGQRASGAGAFAPARRKPFQPRGEKPFRPAGGGDKRPFKPGGRPFKPGDRPFAAGKPRDQKPREQKPWSGKPREDKPWRDKPGGDKFPPRDIEGRAGEAPRRADESTPPPKRSESPDQPPPPEQIVIKPKPPERG